MKLSKVYPGDSLKSRSKKKIIEKKRTIGKRSLKGQTRALCDPNRIRLISALGIEAAIVTSTIFLLGEKKWGSFSARTSA